MRAGRAYFVYRCYDAEGKCVYIGCTSNLQRRMSEHRTQRSGADLAVRIKVSGPYLRTTALELEKRFMDAEQPAWGLTPKRQLLIARGQMERSELYPPHRHLDITSAASGCNDKMGLTA